MKKGFTLIELLAVIVILAIIALIAFPTITGIVERTRKGGAESSALGYIDALEKQTLANMLDDNSSLLTDDVYDVSDLDIKVKGQVPTKGWVKIEKGQVKDYSLVIGEYVVTPKDNNPSKAVAVKGKEPNDRPSNYPKVVYSRVKGTTHVGYPIDANQDMGDKYVVSSFFDVFYFDSLEECNQAGYSNDKCVLKNVQTPDLDYKTSPDESWPFYLKYHLNSNGIIEDAEVCGKHNEEVFCLQRSKDGSKYEQNKELLLNTFDNNKCYDGSSFSCDDDITASINASNSYISVAFGGSCSVYNHGTISCFLY